LYKRHAENDEHVLKLLERRLRAMGHDVFVDRHLSIGVDWAKTIVERIRASDVVIPLISPHSMHSEMLEYEMQAASEAFHVHGKPRILPVRLAYTDALPQVLAGLTDHIQYELWNSPADDESLVEAIQFAIDKPDQPIRSDRVLEQAGGAVPLESPYYLVRETDDRFVSAISRRDSIVLIKGARQMGKTSLLARGLAVARKNGQSVTLTDFQSLYASDLDSVDSLLITLAAMIVDQLEIDADPAAEWDSPLGAGLKLERFLKKHVLSAVPNGLVWGLDEVDRLFTVSFGSEIFGLFRSWHNRRSLDPTGPWANLTLAICYATEAHLFIKDLNQSPFNVGTRLQLQDFTISQVRDLNNRYGKPLSRDSELEEFYGLVNGQPYLVRRGLDELASGVPLEAFLCHAHTDEGIYGDHLRRILVSLSQDQDLMEAVRELLAGRGIADLELFCRLRSAGVVKGESTDDARLRCDLYKLYLGRHLLNQLAR